MGCTVPHEVTVTQGPMCKSMRRSRGTDLAREPRVIGMATGLVAALLISATGEPAVPAGLQAELLARVLRHDRQFSSEPDEPLGVLVVHSGEPASLAAARQLVSALSEQKTLGGRTHVDSLVQLGTVEALLEHAREKRARVIVFAPGTTRLTTVVAQALDGQPIFTVSMTTDGVAAGLLLGFQLDAGKPRMWLNLQQARKQGSDLRAEVVKLMKVVP